MDHLNEVFSIFLAYILVILSKLSVTLNFIALLDIALGTFIFDPLSLFASSIHIIFFDIHVIYYLSKLATSVILD